MIEVEELCALYLAILNFILLNLLQVVYNILMVSVRALVFLCFHCVLFRI